MRIVRMLLSAMVITFLATASAQAVSIGYTLNLSGNVNSPTVKLTNDSSSDLITVFKMTIGLTTKNFDSATGEVLGGVASFTQMSPDDNSGGGDRSDFVHYTFTGFDPGETFRFKTDIDHDDNNTGEDYREVLFNNDNGTTVPNSEITVTFFGGTIFSGYLPDFTSTPHTFSQSQQAQVIPEPSTFILLGFGLLGMAGYARKRMKT